MEVSSSIGCFLLQNKQIHTDALGTYRKIISKTFGLKADHVAKYGIITFYGGVVCMDAYCWKCVRQKIGI